MEKKEQSWRDVKGYEGKYEISDHGQVRRVRSINSKEMSITVDSRGYNKVGLSSYNRSETRTIHSLVAESFLGHNRKNKERLRHIDGNRSNNHASNIRIIVKGGDRVVAPTNFSSDYKGVSLNKSRGTWTSTIGVGGKRKYLGNFKTELEASNAYEAALKTVHP